MSIPTEPIGSIPRPPAPVELVRVIGDNLEPADDLSSSRETAFAKIAASVQGTALAAVALGVS